MKKEKIVESDPIKAKYNKKIGLFKKIKIKFNEIKQKAKSNKSLKEDKDTLVSMLVSIGLYGVLGNLALSIFGFGISFLTILSIGSLLWLVENKFIDFIVRILSSIKIVSLHN